MKKLILFLFIPAVSFAAIEKKATVFTTVLKRQIFTDEIQYPARVKSKINVAVISEIAGEVKSILKPVGSFVRKGEALLVIQNTDPVYRYAPVKIVAPTNGYVTNIDANLYSRVEKGAKLVSITDPKELVIETEIPAADLNYLKIGMAASFQTTSMKDPIQARIKALSPAVDIHTGTACAELEFVQPKVAVAQGLIGQVFFKANPRSSYVIPENAIVYREGKPFIRILEKNKIKRVPVEIAKNMGDKVEIQAGLQDGWEMVIRSSRFVADGEEVEAQKPDAQKPEGANSAQI
jgi:multidrug efflux pump subunit AcrA (membrane-fusion protein)